MPSIRLTFGTVFTPHNSTRSSCETLIRIYYIQNSKSVNRVCSKRFASCRAYFTILCKNPRPPHSAAASVNSQNHSSPRTKQTASFTREPITKNTNRHTVERQRRHTHHCQHNSRVCDPLPPEIYIRFCIRKIFKQSHLRFR